MERLQLQRRARTRGRKRPHRTQLAAQGDEVEDPDQPNRMPDAVRRRNAEWQGFRMEINQPPRSSTGRQTVPGPLAGTCGVIQSQTTAISFTTAQMLPREGRSPCCTLDTQQPLRSWHISRASCTVCICSGILFGIRMKPWKPAGEKAAKT